MLHVNVNSGYTFLWLELLKKVGSPETHSDDPASSFQTPQGSVRSCIIVYGRFRCLQATSIYVRPLVCARAGPQSQEA